MTFELVAAVQNYSVDELHFSEACKICMRIAHPDESATSAPTVLIQIYIRGRNVDNNFSLADLVLCYGIL